MKTMSLQELSLIGRPEITSIRMLLAVDSDVIRRVLSDFLQDEPLIEIVGEAKDFTELPEKVLALKPRIVLMDLHMRDQYKFKPEFVRSELQASAGHVLAMSNHLSVTGPNGSRSTV
jgi:DNA-binding NarL/FixJ family response regulator